VHDAAELAEGSNVDEGPGAGAQDAVSAFLSARFVPEASRLRVGQQRHDPTDQLPLGFRWLPTAELNELRVPELLPFMQRSAQDAGSTFWEPSLASFAANSANSCRPGLDG
jgi:hypothetical protein